MITRFAHERGHGVGMLDEIEVLGEKIDAVRLDFKKSKYFAYKFPDFSGNIFSALLKKFQALKYLKMYAKNVGYVLKAVLHLRSHLNLTHSSTRKKCIKCYCCHELCPNGAVELKHRSWKVDFEAHEL